MTIIIITTSTVIITVAAASSSLWKSEMGGGKVFSILHTNITYYIILGTHVIHRARIPTILLLLLLYCVRTIFPPISKKKFLCGHMWRRRRHVLPYAAATATIPTIRRRRRRRRHSASGISNVPQ